jgi:hypothetical protein
MPHKINEVFSREDKWRDVGVRNTFRIYKEIANWKIQIKRTWDNSKITHGSFLIKPQIICSYQSG